jgi:thioredoxin reductase (NADPH)
MQDRVRNNPKIEMLLNREVLQITGSKQTGVTSLTLLNKDNKSEEQLAVDALFVAIGHTPNSTLFKGVLEMDENGYLIVEPNSTKTRIPGVFACGDVQDHVFRQAITAAGTGCMAAIEAERWLEEHGE